MSKYIYTYQERRLTENFLDSWIYRTYERRGGLDGMIAGVEYTMPKLLFFVSKEVVVDEDFLEALEFYTDNRSWGIRHREDFVIVEDTGSQDRPDYPMLIKDEDGWSKILYMGERAMESLKPIVRQQEENLIKE